MDLEMMDGSSGLMMTMNESLPFNPFENCTIFIHCRFDELSDTSISCPPIWFINPPEAVSYSPYVAAIEAVFFAVAFFWNLFILISYVVHRNLLKEPANVYLFNLALTDLMLAIFVVLQCFITEAQKGFLVGNTDPVRCGLCEFLGFMLMLLMTSTLHTLAILSFDRFFLLVKPLSYKQYFNWKKSIAIVIFIWILSFCMAVPPFLGLGSYGFSFVIGNCHPQWSFKSFRGIDNFHYITFLALEAMVPILFLAFANILTYKIVTKVLRKKFKRQASFTEAGRETKMAHNRQQRQLVKVFGALFVAHIICWMPVLVVVVVSFAIDPQLIPIEVFIICWILYLTNPVIHPILETFFIKDLRSRVNNAQKKVKTSIRRVSSLGTSFIQKSASRTSLKLGKRDSAASLKLGKRDSTQSMDTVVTKASLTSRSSLMSRSSISDSSPPNSPPMMPAGSLGNEKPFSPALHDVAFTIYEEPELQQETPQTNGGVANGGPTTKAFSNPTFLSKRPSVTFEA